MKLIDRIKDMPAGRVVGLAALFSLTFFAVWVGLIVVVWRIFGLGSIPPTDFWGAVESLSSAATLATVIGGGLFALLQVVESVDSRQREVETRNLEIYNNIFERLTSDRNIAARRWIYQHLTGDPATDRQNLTADGQEHIKLVLNSLDHLGFLIRQDWITSEAIIDWVSPFVVKVWEKLGPYVDDEAIRRNEPDYYEAVRHLAEHCKAWRETKYSGVQHNWVKDAL